MSKSRGKTRRSPREKFSHDRRLARVALIIETSHSFGREIFRGITRYLRENKPWSVFFVELTVCDGVPKWLKKWSGDGIISRVATPDFVKFVADSDIPTVDLNQQLRGLGAPLVSIDHAAVGRMAAEHLLQRGFHEFGFIGHSGLLWSDDRRDAFIDTVHEGGGLCHVYSCGSQAPRRFLDRTWELEMEDVVRWASSLPQPVGIMASDDFRGLQLIEACAIARIAVPQEAAVVGVGNDNVACELASPPLSSVVLNAYQMGYEAASLLDRLMRGEKVGRKERLLPPLDIVTRQSSDVMAVADPVVSKAMQFIHQYACEGINIPDILRHVLVSRSVLQDRFRKTFECTIHDMILDTRIKHAKELLAQTELSLAEIARRSGFKHVEYLCEVFKKGTGWTPGQYRAQHGQKLERRFQIDT